MKKYVDREDLVRNRLMKQQRLAERYGRQSRDQFALQDRVVVRDPGTRRWVQEGTVIEERKAEDGRAVSFVIKFDNGRTTIRHKWHMRFAVKKNEESERVRSLS